MVTNILHLRNMDMHGLIAFATRFLVDKSRTHAFDLNTSSCLLLNVLDEHTLRQLFNWCKMLINLDQTYRRADDLCTNIEVAQRLDAHWNFLFRPFPL